jgi:hypothetical protein
MKYHDGEIYEGQYAGVKIRFSLQNFTPQVVEKFNQMLAKEALKTIENERSDRILS